MSNSEMELLQRRLNQVEASHARLLHHLPGMAYRCKVERDYEYTLVFASRGCEKLLGMSETAVMSAPTNTVEQLTLEEDLAAMRRTIYEALLSRRGYELYYRIRLASGEEKWIWDQGEGVFSEDGECLFLEGIMMDVTAQKKKELTLKRENRALRKDGPRSGGLGKIVGASPAMQRVYDLMTKAAKSDTSVILYGETGVGKDLAARTIHDLSGLQGRFIPVNCAAIPEQLLESEFFGHIKGAFSGAATNRPGYLAAANKGTLFLDEIAELPLHLQVKLLRALESKTYTPVGSTEVRGSEFRLVAATNRDLTAMVREKAMRADFFYRIHVLTIVLPPLRERKGDIPLLVRAYARHKGVVEELPAALLASFEVNPWPGNVRELQNTLERYWAFGAQGMAPEVCPDIFSVGAHAPGPASPLRETVAAASAGLSFAAPPSAAAPSLSAARDDIEKEQILAALREQGGRKGKTAEALGVTLRTLQRKLKKYGFGRGAEQLH
ncbi:MAG: sigma 54-interacting transcriptional regulator [Desulfovibrio sp.]|nr:sigma 54-interacting transcriptional regulator [Desulfovibrio sp.]